MKRILPLLAVCLLPVGAMADPATQNPQYSGVVTIIPDIPTARTTNFIPVNSPTNLVYDPQLDRPITIPGNLPTNLVYDPQLHRFRFRSPMKVQFVRVPLQFRLVEDNPTADSEPMTVVGVNDPSWSRQPLVLNVQKTALLDQSDVKSATVYSGDKTRGQTVIYINFTGDGTKRFAEATRQNIGRRLAVVIDGKLCMAPRINSAITGGVAQIPGAFTKEEAENLAARLNGSSGIIHASQPVFVIPHFFLLCLIAAGAGVVTLILIFRKHTPPAA